MKTLEHQAATGCPLGKYGSLVMCERTRQSSADDELPFDEFCRRLCQQVIGMNPRTIGLPDDEQHPPGNPEEETRLIYQEYMHDTSLIVCDALEQTGVKVLDFVRLECGEQLPEDESV